MQQRSARRGHGASDPPRNLIVRAHYPGRHQRATALMDQHGGGPSRGQNIYMYMARLVLPTQLHAAIDQCLYKESRL